jgi:hypothetical protein
MGKSKGVFSLLGLINLLKHNKTNLTINLAYFIRLCREENEWWLVGWV